MAIPAQIVAGVQALIASVKAGSPLKALSRMQLASLQNDAASLVVDVDGALAAAAGALDSGDPSGFPGVFGDYLLALAQASEDQATLCDVRGFVGRAAFNLDQVLS